MGSGIRLDWPRSMENTYLCRKIAAARSWMIRLLAANESMQWIIYAVGALTIVSVVLRPSFRKKDPLAQSGSKLSMSQQRSVEREMSTLLVELADAGHSAAELAQQLDRPRGEVELILALRAPSESQS